MKPSFVRLMAKPSLVSPSFSRISIGVFTPKSHIPYADSSDNADRVFKLTTLAATHPFLYFRSILARRRVINAGCS
uniref:Uncharacterized protein n=1 Tax=Kalanchoe fedtschenkoi TaxID=63787 RepID=A0A7N0UPC6_KALFE